MFENSASLFIAAPNFCNESNVEPGKPIILCIASTFDKTCLRLLCYFDH
jgi:hypothetical protein